MKTTRGISKLCTTCFQDVRDFPTLEMSARLGKNQLARSSNLEVVSGISGYSEDIEIRCGGKISNPKRQKEN